MKIILFVLALAVTVSAASVGADNNTDDTGKADKAALYQKCYDLLASNSIEVKHVTDYLDKLSYDELSEKKNLNFLFDFIYINKQIAYPVGSDAFRFWVNNREKFSDIMGKENARNRYIFLLKEWRSYALENDDEALFKRVNDKLKKHCGESKVAALEFRTSGSGITAHYFQENFDYSILKFYKANGHTGKFNELFAKAKNKFWDDHKNLNDIIFGLQQLEAGNNDLKKYKSWIERSVELNRNYSNLQTYASILYQMEEYNKAKKIAEEALTLLNNKFSNHIKVLVKKSDVNKTLRKINIKLSRK